MPAMIVIAGILSAVAAVATAPAEAGSGDAARVMSIAEILALPLDALDETRPATATGTVTLIRRLDGEHAFIVIQEGYAAVFVDLRRRRDLVSQLDDGGGGLGFHVGSFVEVSGTVEEGAFAPTVMASSIRVLGEGTLPDAPLADMERLFEGIDAAKRVVLRGTVQGVEERTSQKSWSLIVRSGGHTVMLEAALADFLVRPDWLIDAEIEAIGVVGSLRNTRGELIAPIVSVARRDDIVVLVPAPPSPFDSQKFPLDAIARFRPTRRGGHRVCTTGVVSRAFADKLFLFEGGGGVRVDLGPGADTATFVPGDRVDVAGFVTMARGIAGLAGATVRKIDSVSPPAPLSADAIDVWSADERLSTRGAMARPGNYDGCLVRCRARLESVNVAADTARLLLSAGPVIFSASLPAGPPSVAAATGLEPGSDVELTGIVQAELSGAGRPSRMLENPRSDRFDLLLSGPADVVVLRSPPWWTPRRLAIAAVALAATVGAAGIWLALLRREVKRQTARAVAAASARRQDSLEYEVSLRERNRLAADLHDTILQTVTGIGFQLHVCEEIRARPSAAAGPGREASIDHQLSAAKHMVEQAVSQLRSTVWSLRTQPADGLVFSAALNDALARLGEGHVPQTSVAIDDAANQLPAFLGGSLLQIIKEAVHNSLRHAAPHAIDVRVTIDTAADTVTVSVADDGDGFEIGAQPGPAEGHFGLTGMRERAADIGGSFTIRSMPEAGTTVVVTAPLAGRPRK